MRLSLAHPRRVLAVVLVLTAVVGLGALRLEVDTDPENSLPADHPVRVRNEALRSDFGSPPTVQVLP